MAMHAVLVPAFSGVPYRFVGGFARAGSVSPDEYRSAQPDPIAGFGSHIAAHMNDDHQDSTIGKYSFPGAVRVYY